MSETNYLGQQEGEHSFVLTARMMSAGLTHVNVHGTVAGGGPSDREQRYRVTARVTAVRQLNTNFLGDLNEWFD